MAEPINLNRFRKSRAKAEAKATAELNRVKHGRTLAERKASEAERERLARLIDGARLEPDAP